METRGALDASVCGNNTVICKLEYDVASGNSPYPSLTTDGTMLNGGNTMFGLTDLANSADFGLSLCDVQRVRVTTVFAYAHRKLAS